MAKPVRARFYEGLNALAPQFKRQSERKVRDPRVGPAGNLLATAEPFVLQPGSYRSVTPWENDAIYTRW